MTSYAMIDCPGCGQLVPKVSTAPYNEHSDTCDLVREFRTVDTVDSEITGEFPSMAEVAKLQDRVVQLEHAMNEARTLHLDIEAVIDGLDTRHLTAALDDVHGRASALYGITRPNQRRRR